MSRTIVAFHAHPDDEALLTAGTMARLAAEGHRVVLVLATDGGAGLAAAELRDDGALGARRLHEARRSAEVLGVARVEWLGYADSGSGPEPEPDTPGVARFCRAPLEEAAERLAAVLRTERADLLISYDANGGYGHRDHVRVHEVGARAAAVAGTPRVLEATVPRDTVVRAVRAVGRVYRFPAEFDPSSFERAFSARSEITHRIDVRRYVAAKRESMRAHASQATGGGAASVGAGGQTGDRTLGAFLRIPRPLYDLVFGREWFRDPSLPAGAAVRTDLFEGDR
jgi:LmbE family N-acetylglucosaminyl deacetylase